MRRRLVRSGASGMRGGLGRRGSQGIGRTREPFLLALAHHTGWCGR